MPEGGVLERPRSSTARQARFFVLLSLTATSWGQTVPNAGLQYVENVLIPNWTTSGSTQANFDLFYFNPATRIMYVADRTNHSVTAIDTEPTLRSAR